MGHHFCQPKPSGRFVHSTAMAFGATLSEQRPVTEADLHRRIVHGRPVWTFSPNAPRRPVVRPLTMRLHPAAFPVVLSLLPAAALVPHGQMRRIFARQAGQAVPASTARPMSAAAATTPDGDVGPIQDNGALYLQAEILLAAWRKTHAGVCDPPDFGDRADDFRGMADERTVRAIKSFQKWGNAHGAELTPDGQLDVPTYALLMQVGGEALQQHAIEPNKPAEPSPKSRIGLGVFAAAALAAGGLWLLLDEGV